MEEKSHRSDCDVLWRRSGSVVLVSVLQQLLPRNYGGLTWPELHREHLPVAFLHERRRRPLLLRHRNTDTEIRELGRAREKKHNKTKGIACLLASDRLRGIPKLIHSRKLKKIEQMECVCWGFNCNSILVVKIFLLALFREKKTGREKGAGSGYSLRVGSK